MAPIIVEQVLHNFNFIIYLSHINKTNIPTLKEIQLFEVMLLSEQSVNVVANSVKADRNFYGTRIFLDHFTRQQPQN